MPLPIRITPTTINATRPMVRGFPSSHRLHAVSRSAERSGATTARTIGAEIVVIEASAKTMKATTASAVETCALRISIAAATVSEYVSMNEPTRTASSQFVRSGRATHLGVWTLAVLLLRRGKARAEAIKTTQPSTISTAEAVRDGVVLCELKS